MHFFPSIIEFPPPIAQLVTQFPSFRYKLLFLHDKQCELPSSGSWSQVRHSSLQLLLSEKYKKE
jgi:hypothetical protein